MGFVVAGVMLLAAMVIAGIALFIPLDPEEADENTPDMALPGDGRSPAAAIKSCVASSSWAHRGMIFVSSLLCAAVGWIAVGVNPAVWGYGRWCVAALMLLPAMIIDQRSHRIPNLIVLAGFIGGVVLLGLEFVFQRETAGKSLITGLIGAAFCMVLLYIMARLTKEGIGMGDVKLISALGWLLGLVSALIALFLALVLCALTAAVLLISKKKGKNDFLPFAPFLFMGYTMMMLLYCL